MTIVGVVGTVKQYGLDVDGRIAIYRPSPGLMQYQVVRTSLEPGGVAAAMMREIQSVDPTIPVFDVQTMHARMSDSLARQRFASTLLGAFAVFALILAMVGVYGVMSYLVTQGTHEIGVRMALGAERRTILGMVVRQGMELTVVGVLIGLVFALGLSRVMATLLFGIGARDVATFAVVPILLIVVALVACYLPARRATRVDPQVALRVE
jgi:ABC-type antimicrobial peptide transport system permease subunit